MGRRKKKSEPTSPKVIKRYGNRKLYDTQESRYVTLEEISNMVRHGEDIRVIDNRTKEDLTAVTLTQIMLEEQKNKHNILPLALCKNLIQEGGERFSEWLQRGKESLSSMRIEADKHLVRWIEKGHGAREEATPFLRDLIANPQKALDVIQKRIDDRIRYFLQQVTGLEEIEKQIQELEDRLARLEKRLSQARG